jgi:hypothetical protein
MSTELEHQLLGDAERQLIDLVRDGDVADFSLTIVRHAGAWTVARTNFDSGAYSSGTALSFAEAWEKQEGRC